MIRIDTDAGVSGWGELSDLAHGHPMNFPDFEVVAELASRRIAGADPRNTDEALHVTNWTVHEALSFLDRSDPSCPFFPTVSFIVPIPRPSHPQAAEWGTTSVPTAGI